MKSADIKFLRHNILHLSQPQFAKVMGSCVATVSRWESGKTRPVGLSVTVLEACNKAVINYGQQRIRGVDWGTILEQEGLMKLLAGIFNFATTKPVGRTIPAPPVDDEGPDDDMDDADDLEDKDEYEGADDDY